jgi:hypothetical protein
MAKQSCALLHAITIQHSFMTEDRYRWISARLQKIGTVGALIGAAVALWQYIDASQKQFQAPIWQKQVELYTSATETIARLAFTKDPTEWKNARIRFWELYAGSLILVEDNTVAEGMVDFGKRLKVVGDDLSKRDDEFEQSAIRLSYTFRKSIEDSVGSNLPALKAQRIQ